MICVLRGFREMVARNVLLVSKVMNVNNVLNVSRVECQQCAQNYYGDECGNDFSLSI